MSDFFFGLLIRFPGIVRFVTRIRWLRYLISNFAINKQAYSVNPRPRPYSMIAPYTTWQSLTDRSFTGRHLPEMEKTRTCLTSNRLLISGEEKTTRSYHQKIPVYCSPFLHSGLQTAFSERISQIAEKTHPITKLIFARSMVCMRRLRIACV